MNNPPSSAAVGQMNEGCGDPSKWREYVNCLYRTMCENFDTSDQVVVALHDDLSSVEQEVDRMLAMAKKWGDLLPFLTKERLMLLCTTQTNRSRSSATVR